LAILALATKNRVRAAAAAVLLLLLLLLLLLRRRRRRRLLLLCFRQQNPEWRDIGEREKDACARAKPFAANKCLTAMQLGDTPNS